MIQTRGVLFDLDGTLVDSGLDLAASVNHALRAMGLPVGSVERIRSYVGDGVKKLLERSLGEDNLHRLEEMERLFTPHYEAHCTDETKLYPGAYEALQKLKEVFPLGLITNKDRDFSMKILSGLGIDHFFDDVVGGDTLPNLKPAPDGVFYFAKRFGVKPEELVMIGDHITDLEMCKRAGCRSVFCRFGMGKKGEFVADAEIDSFSELPALLSTF